MALTRRFFTKLAAQYREARPAGPQDTTAYAVWAHLVTITAGALAEQNAMFNYAKFYEACGMDDAAVARVAG